MSNSTEILLRDGRFFRRNIQEVDLGPQDRILRSMIRNSRGITAPNIYSIDYQMSHHDRDTETGQILYTSSRYRLPVHLYVNGTLTCLITEMPFITFKAPMIIRKIMGHPSIIPAFNGQQWGVNVPRPDGQQIMSLPVIMPDDCRVFIVSQWQPNSLTAFMVVSDGKHLRAMPINNVFADNGTVCLGAFWPDPGKDLITRNQLLISHLMEEEYNQDLRRGTTVQNLVWDVKTFRRHQNEAFNVMLDGTISSEGINAIANILDVSKVSGPEDQKSVPVTLPVFGDGLFRQVEEPETNETEPEETSRFINPDTLFADAPTPEPEEEE